MTMRDDILLDNDFDLIDNGTEWEEGESDQQHVEMLMLLNKGELKEFPFVGFGAYRRINSVFDKAKTVRELKIELENDGYNNATIIIGDNLEDLKIEI